MIKFPMQLLATGLNHQTAPLSLREQMVFSKQDLERCLQDLVAQTDIKEAVLLSTCHRTEIYCSAIQPEQIVLWLSRRRGIPYEILNKHCYHLEGTYAFRHILRVACGLESMALGEQQIMGQIKSAYFIAQQSGVVGKQLGNFFNQLFAISKRIRTHSRLSTYPISITYAAVSLTKRIFARVEELKILLVGTGETIELSLKYLQKFGVSYFIICGRNDEKRKQLAESVNGVSCSLEELPKIIPEADVIICATENLGIIIRLADIERAVRLRKRRPICLLDFSVPRNIDPSIDHLEEVYLYNIDDMQAIVDYGIENRQKAAKEAENLLEKEIESFRKKDKKMIDINTLCAYREKIKGYQQSELERGLKDLDIGKDPAEVIKQTMHRLVQKILHEPTMQIKQASVAGQEEIARLMRQLYALD